MLEKIKNNKTILILIGIMLVSSMWLITKGMPYAHDIEFHYGRIIGLSRSIKSGNFIALIHDFYYGYGYATGIFYSNFYFYIPAILNVIGFSYLSSLKVLYLLINVFTTLSIYFCLKSITKDKKLSIIGTILYMFSNYRLVDIYPRGAMGEMLSFMIIPIVLLGIYEIVFRDYKKWYIFTISFVGLLLCHLITTFLVAVFIFIFILCNYKKFIEDKNRIKYLIISGIIGLLLGSFFLLPIIEQKINGNINIFVGNSYFLPQDNIVNIKNFLVPTGFFNTNLGIVLILLLPIRLLVKNKKVKKNDRDLLKYADIFYILGIIAWISTTKIFPWKVFGNSLGFIQFPWRLLIISTPFLVFSYIIYFKLIDNKKLLKYTYIFIILISLSEVLLYSVQYGLRNKSYDLKTTEIGTEEYLLYGTDTDKLDKDMKVLITNNHINMVHKRNGLSYEIVYSSNNYKNTYIEVPLFNYLGYKASGDAKLVNGDNNLIRLELTKETGRINVYYEYTIIQKMSYIVSFVTALGLFIYLKKERGNKDGISK